MKPHKHAELIKAWADGAEIQYKPIDGVWVTEEPLWCEEYEYRIKPEPKPDNVICFKAYTSEHLTFVTKSHYEGNLKLTFDGETGELKSAEVLK